MGEALPFILARSSSNLRDAAGLSEPLEDYVAENFHVTTSGMFTYPPLLCLLLVIGADRVMFSVDYPFSSNTVGRKFLDNLALCPEDLEKITHRNAEKLFRL